MTKEQAGRALMALQGAMNEVEDARRELARAQEQVSEAEYRLARLREQHRPDRAALAVAQGMWIAGLFDG